MAQHMKNLPAMQEPQEIQVRSLGQEDPLEEEMATHSSILSWKIPWTEKPWPVVHGVAKSWICLKDWTTTTGKYKVYGASQVAQ